MAQLGLAIGGVAATAGSLSRTIFGIYHSARNACRDAETISIELKLLRAVLVHLRITIVGKHCVISDSAKETVEELLRACRAIFYDIDKFIQPLLARNTTRKNQPRLVRKIAWHFKQDDVRLLIGQLDSLKSTLNLMIGILILGENLSRTNLGGSTIGQVSAHLRTSLSTAGQRVTSQRICLTNLAIIEQQVLELAPDVGEIIVRTPSLRVSAWLDSLVCLQSEVNTVTTSSHSTKSSSILSDEQRSVMGNQSSDVENLLTRWTLLGETRSRKGSSVSEVLGAEGAVVTETETTVDSASDDGSWATVADDEDHPNDTALKIDTTQNQADNQDDIPSQEPEIIIPPPSAVPLDHDNNAGRVSTGREQFYTYATTVKSEDDSDGSASVTVRDGQTLKRKGKIKAKESKFGSKYSHGRQPQTHIDHENPDHNQNVNRGTAKIVKWLDEQNVNLPPLTASTTSNVGHILYGIDVNGSTTSISTSAISSISTISNTTTPDAKKLLRVARNMFKLGQTKQAFSLYLKAYKQKDELEPSELIDLQWKICQLLIEHSEFEKAELMLHKTISMSKLLYAGGQGKAESLAVKQHVLGRLLSARRKWKEASEIYRAVWEVRKVNINSDNQDCFRKAVQTGTEYSTTLLQLAQNHEIIELLEPIYLQTHDRKSDVDGQILDELNFNLAKSYRLVSRLPEAKGILERVIGSQGNVVDASASMIASCRQELCMIEFSDGNYGETRRLAKLVIEYSGRVKSKATINRRESSFVDSERYLAMAEMRLGNFEAADQMFIKTTRNLKSAYGLDHPHVIESTIDHANVLSKLGEHKQAEHILDLAFSNIADTSHKHDIKTGKINPAGIQIAQLLGPLIIRNSNKGAEESSEANKYAMPVDRLRRAMHVYTFLYNGQKLDEKIDLQAFLQTSHDYGCLCSITKQYPQAERVLRQTWVDSKRILGESHDLSLQTGMQLGHVLFQKQNQAEAIAAFSSVYDIRVDLYGLKSINTVLSAEMLALSRLSAPTATSEAKKQALQLLEDAVNARFQVQGSTRLTWKAAFKVALLNGGQGNLVKCQEWYQWIFDNGQPKAKIQKDKISAQDMYLAFAGMSSAMLAYVNTNERSGNQILSDVVARMRDNFGCSPETDKFMFAQAAVLLIQRRGALSIALLRKVYKERRKAYGRSSKFTSAAGNLLILGLIANSVISGKVIPQEAMQLHESILVNGRGWSPVMRTCSAVGLLFTTMSLHHHAVPLLRWVYQIEKARAGRFSFTTLRALAILHACTSHKLYRKLARKPSQFPDQIDLNRWLINVWAKLKRGIEIGAQRLDDSGIGGEILAAVFAKRTLWKMFESEIGSFAGVDATPWFSHYSSKETTDSNDAKVWTIYDDSDDSSGAESTSTLSEGSQHKGRSAAKVTKDDDSAILGLSDILGSDLSDRLSSLGASVIDLTALSDIGVGNAERDIDELESELVGEILVDIDLESVKSHAVDWEREAGVSAE